MQNMVLVFIVNRSHSSTQVVQKQMRVHCQMITKTMTDHGD